VQNRIITKLCKQSTAGRFLGKLAANLELSILNSLARF